MSKIICVVFTLVEKKLSSDELHFGFRDITFCSRMYSVVNCNYFNSNIFELK